MKSKRRMALVILTLFSAACSARSHAGSGVPKAGASAKRNLVREGNGLILAGTLGQALTAPVAGREWSPTVPLNRWVQQGETIGAEPSHAVPAEEESARQELEEARAGEQRAQDRVRQVEEEVIRVRAQAGSLASREALAEAAEFEAEHEFDRRDAAFHSGLTSWFDHSTAVTERDSAEAAVGSIRSNLSALSIEANELQAKSQAAQAALGAATARRNAAEAGFERMQGAPPDSPIVAPADGVIVASRQPEGTRLEIASDPGQLWAHAMVRQADLMTVRVGQESLIVLDAQPAVTFHARVSAISETPVDPEGVLYQVTFVVDNPGGTWLSGAAMHARMAPSTR